MGIYNPYIVNHASPGFNANLQHLFAPTTAFSYGPNLQIPMQKVYNINLPGPTGGHVEMNKIYENILPNKNIPFTFLTLGERITMYDYIRQILVQLNDGENISLDSSGHRSLLSYLKFMELNPNYYNPIYNNPYKGLPYGLLIYNSCFPITLDQKSQSVVCSRDSVGLNIRLYSLTVAEYYSFLFRQPIFKEYDVWREIAYYEYVRENIIKKKQCPNFTILYAFFLSPNNKIDFFSLKKGCLTQKDLLTVEYQRFLQTYKLTELPPNFETRYRPLTLSDYGKRVINKLPDEIDPELQVYSGTTMIAITESPNYNFYQWASRKYETRGIVKKMVNQGFYGDKIWLSVLFQIICALYVLQIHGIYIRNMTMEDNVYIKEIPSNIQTPGYWKYIINGISYYIPNYGYLVLIDTNFKDIIPQSKTLPNTKREYKIYTSDIFGKRYAIESIKDKIFENYRNIITTNIFTKEHTLTYVMKPSDFILNFLNTLTEITDKNIGNIFINHFRNFLNNRIGTLLHKDNEVPNIREAINIYKNGEMAIEIIDEGLYKWCLVINQQDDGIVNILTREKTDDTDIINKQVRIETLRKYANSETIEQTSKSNETNFSIDAMLETYIINEK